MCHFELRRLAPARIRPLCAPWVTGTVCRCKLRCFAPSRVQALGAPWFSSTMCQWDLQALCAFLSSGALRPLGFRRHVPLGTRGASRLHEFARSGDLRPLDVRPMCERDLNALCACACSGAARPLGFRHYVPLRPQAPCAVSGSGAPWVAGTLSRCELRRLARVRGAQRFQAPLGFQIRALTMRRWDFKALSAFASSDALRPLGDGNHVPLGTRGALRLREFRRSAPLVSGSMYPGNALRLRKLGRRPFGFQTRCAAAGSGAVRRRRGFGRLAPFGFQPLHATGTPAPCAFGRSASSGFQALRAIANSGSLRPLDARHYSPQRCHALCAFASSGALRPLRFRHSVALRARTLCAFAESETTRPLGFQTPCAIRAPAPSAFASPGAVRPSDFRHYLPLGTPGPCAFASSGAAHLSGCLTRYVSLRLKRRAPACTSSNSGTRCHCELKALCAPWISGTLCRCELRRLALSRIRAKYAA
jgi:hypothetical protein